MNSTLWELPLVFVSGVLGSAHCIGMCGAISATMNLGTTGVRAALKRQLLWSIGRIFTYAFLGMVAGFAAARFTTSDFATSQASVLTIQASFAILAGALLVYQGIHATGWLNRGVKSGGGCLAASIFTKFLHGGSGIGVFIAGILTGFLPCGLVYSFLALAAASVSVWKGPLLMTVFGLGTVPVMLLTGLGLSMASLKLRQSLMKLAAVCVVTTGLLTVGRGIVFAATSTAEPLSASCPYCDLPDKAAIQD